jgi:hypothetical protein
MIKKSNPGGGGMGFMIQSPGGSSRPEKPDISYAPRRYDVEAARLPVPDSSYEVIRNLVPQEGIDSDGNYEEWLDDDK